MNSSSLPASTPAASIRVGIVGGTGYTGAELLRLLARHPMARVGVITSRKEAGLRVDALYPHLRGAVGELAFEAPDSERLAACDVVFFATPHGVAMNDAPALLEQGVRVIDLSADFRLKDVSTFTRWYRHEHAALEWLARAVYGLPELDREAVRAARLIANPGCYPTVTQLGFAPLLKHGLVDPGSLVADCKSGVSGAGREARIGSLYCEAADSMKAYGVTGHRHLPEIEQGLERLVQGGETVRLTFVPHLVPINRGMHATLYGRLRSDISEAGLRQIFADFYAGEPFVDVIAGDEPPETRSTRGANICRLAVFRPGGTARDTVVVTGVIDNLAKGASAQAVQCMNLMLDFPETAGLDVVPLVP